MIDQANELRQLIRQQAEAPAEAARAGPSLITVTGGKGGVGTTTVAIHLAVALSRQSDRVLLVDADPDRTDVATLCGLLAERDLADLAVARVPLEEVLVPGPDGVFVIGGAERSATSEPSIDRFHRRWMQLAREAEVPFDYVIVDTGNGSSRSVELLWEAAELVLLVTTTELPSILDAYASIKTLADSAAPPAIHTLVNQVNEPAVAYDVHGRLARAVWRFLGFHLDSAGHVAVDPPPSDNDATGRPLAIAKPESRLAREFAQLARTLRTALQESARRQAAPGRIGPGDKKDHSEAINHPVDGTENLVCQLTGNKEKQAM